MRLKLGRPDLAAYTRYFDQPAAGGDPVFADVVQQHVVSAQGANMGDAGAHLARADHADGLDLNHAENSLE